MRAKTGRRLPPAPQWVLAGEPAGAAGALALSHGPQLNKGMGAPGGHRGTHGKKTRCRLLSALELVLAGEPAGGDFWDPPVAPNFKKKTPIKRKTIIINEQQKPLIYYSLLHERSAP